MTMKRLFSFVLAACLLMTCFVGCSKSEKLSEGKNNEKLVGAWIVIKETKETIGRPHYWEFKADNTMVSLSANGSENNEVNPLFYDDVPIDIRYMTFELVNSTREDCIYSYTDGYGLDLQKGDNSKNLVTYSRQGGWEFVFLNTNKFVLTAESGSTFYGYRLKESLVVEQ